MRALKILTAAILDNAQHQKWSVQGFGVLRLYIRDIGRLHIWDSALRYPGVSLTHNHSWDLKSQVIAGVLENTRFTESIGGLVSGEMMPRWKPYWKQRLLTGYKSKMVSEPTLVALLDHEPEVYVPGDTYHQRASEIHVTNAVDGTITLMERREDVDGHADVYWPQDCTWGTAIPRRATEAEIEATVAKALSRLENAL